MSSTGKRNTAATQGVSSTSLVLATSLFIVLLCNLTFFRHLLEVYPLAAGNLAFVISVGLLQFALLVLFLGLICFRRTAKPVLIVILLSTAVAAYFIDAFDIVLDTGMIGNTLNTDVAEVRDLLNVKIFLYFIFLGILPSILVMRSRLRVETFPRQLARAFASTAVSALVIAVTLMTFSGQYTDFFREHKPLRYYSNPLFNIYSGVQYAARHGSHSGEAESRTVIGDDASTPADDNQRELVILVVGEAARADRFSLNGYARDTNPMLEAEEVVSFTNMRSCGTATMVSVPCIFSDLGREDFSNAKAAGRQNLLDVLKHAGVNVLWRDNNSSSKGVAVDVPYESFKDEDTNSICDSECRDVGMLVQLQDFVDAHPDGDIFVVLHQMGNHGPAYYKRYPQDFARFLPACDTSQLQDCSGEELGNAYDNAILYTDYFLARVVDFLKANDSAFETAMFYVSDHGESLGEGGIYLHGLPYFMAPDNQTHVASVLWLGDKFKVDRGHLRTIRDQPFSHDNVFHTVLGLMEVRTEVYRPDLDMLFDPRRLAAAEASAPQK